MASIANGEEKVIPLKWSTSVVIPLSDWSYGWNPACSPEPPNVSMAADSEPTGD